MSLITLFSAGLTAKLYLDKAMAKQNDKIEGMIKEAMKEMKGMVAQRPKEAPKTGREGSRYLALLQ